MQRWEELYKYNSEDIDDIGCSFKICNRLQYNELRFCESCNILFNSEDLSEELKSSCPYIYCISCIEKYKMSFN